MARVGERERQAEDLGLAAGEAPFRVNAGDAQRRRVDGSRRGAGAHRAPRPLAT